MRFEHFRKTYPFVYPVYQLHFARINVKILKQELSGLSGFSR